MPRSDVVVDLIEIAVIGKVDYIETETDLARTEVKPARDAEVPVDLGIDGKNIGNRWELGSPT
jgi:hypothetical protein